MQVSRMLLKKQQVHSLIILKKRQVEQKSSVSTGSNPFSRTMKNVQKEFQKNVGRVTNPIRKTFSN